MDKVPANRVGYKGFIMMAIVMVAFLVLNLLTPEYHDDFVYKFVFEGGAVNYDHPIRSLGDVFQSQVEHYRCVNGRSLVHLLVQLFTGLLGKPVFNVFNVIVFGLFLFLLKRPLGKSRNLLAFMVTLALVLLLPRFKDTFLWMTGSVNYLWSATAALLFLLLYEKHRTKSIDWNLLPLLIAAFLLGWTHEGITLPLGAALVVIHLFNIKKSQSSGQGLWLALAYLAGGCVIALAPGTIARSGVGGLAPSSWALKIFAGFIVLGKLRLFYLALLASIIGWLIDREALRRAISCSGYLLLAALFSLVIVFASGLESTRTAFGLEFFSMLYLLRLLTEWLPRLQPQAARWTGLAMAAGLLVFYGLLLSHTIPSWQESRRLVAQIENTHDGIIGTNEHHAGCFSPYVCTMLSPDSTSGAMNYDAHGWPASIAATYHRDSLVFLPQAFLDDLRARPERYVTPDLCTPYEFYVQRIDDAAVIGSVTLELAPNDFSDVPFLLRPIARRMNRYTATVVPTTKWATVTLQGHRYLLIKKDRALAPRLRAIHIQQSQ